MFKNRIEHPKIMMNCWLFTPILLMLLLVVWGCGSSDETILLPTNDASQADLDESILAAPKGDNNYYYVERVITIYGGKLQGGNVAQGTRLHFPEGALDQKTLISMEVESDADSRIDFRFGPHGIFFAKPVTLELSWAVMKNVNAEDLVLYYYDDKIEDWLEETMAVWDSKRKKATLYIDHFSQYYFCRR